MRTALLAPASAIHTVRWAGALAERGIDVHLFSAHPLTLEMNPAVNFHQLPHGVPHGYVLNRSALSRRLDCLRPDVLHAHYGSGYGTLLRFCDHPRTMLSVWGSDVFVFPERSFLHRRMLLKNLRRPDWLCSTSHVMADQVARLAPDLGQIEVIPFGVDTDRFRPAAPRAGSEEIVIGTVKTLRPKYGIDTLIKGFAMCRERLQVKGRAEAARLRLRIAGDGPDQARLRSLAQSLGVTEVTTFLGLVPHDRVPAELQKLDVYVAASRCDSESFGVAVIEASACGVPVVVSNAGGLPEVVRRGATGIVVPREDESALADELTRLALDHHARARLGSAGRKHVESIYDWDRCVDQQIAAYERLLRSNAVAA